MSGDSISVALERRDVIGKGLAQLRADGHIPAVIHDHGKPSMHVMADFSTLSKVYAQAGKHHPVELQLDGKQHLALIKDVDIEPTKQRMRHVVFQAIKQDEEVEAEIPVVFAEVDIPAEKMSLLVLKQLDHVQIKALPKNLPDQLVVDPSSLNDVGDHLTVADLPIPEGVTILTAPETSIAAVEMPKDQLAEADKAAEELAADKAASESSEEEAETPAEETEAPAEGEATESSAEDQKQES